MVDELHSSEVRFYWHPSKVQETWRKLKKRHILWDSLGEYLEFILVEHFCLTIRKVARHLHESILTIQQQDSAWVQDDAMISEQAVKRADEGA